MRQNIDEELLIAVLEGRATAETEKVVEAAIEEEPSVRLRMEQLSGAIHWPLGSAPITSNPISESLHTAILRLEQDWDRVLTAHSREAASSDEFNSDSSFTEIPSVRIVREIGRGGMGVVYEGVDDALGRRVAIKQLHTQYYRDAKATERLKREAQAIASLNHPNVLAIYGLQLVGGYPCLIQQFVDGESLQSVIHRDGSIPFPQCAEIALQIAQGLAAAHSAGIIHRDLKPDNVLVEHGTHIARLGDFGLAKRLDDEHVTMEGVVAGTPAYMAPEQTDGKGVDHRTDLFSFGTLLYTLAAGRPPFEGNDPYVIMQAIRSRPHTPLESVSSEIPFWYARLVDRLLEKDPTQRPQSVDQVVEALQQQSYDNATTLQRLAIPWTAVAATGILVAAILSWYAFTKDQGTKDNEGKTEQRNEIVSNPNLIRPAIVLKSDTRPFERLEDAIANATDGETIVIASDLDLGRIEIIGKRIQFEAGSKTRPTLRFRAASDDESGIFLRSDSDLSFKGLRIECQTNATVPWMEGGKLVSGIYTAQGKKLRIEDCLIHRMAGGVCLGVGGDLEMLHTWIEGGDVGIAWYALDSSCRVEESFIRSKIGIGVLYPAANIKPLKTSEFTIARSSLVTDATIDLLLARIPSLPVNFQFDRCVLDSKHAASLRTLPALAAEMNSSDAMIDALIRSAHWHDTACVFATGMDYLISRRIRTPNRKNSAGIRSWEDWAKNCTHQDEIDPTGDPASIECGIETEAPKPSEHLDWKPQDSLHRFTPALPVAWENPAIKPGVPGRGISGG